MINPFSVEGKTILITGASSGIGKAVAVQISSLGGSVVITGRDEVRLEETFLNLKSGNNLKCLADLTNREQLYTLVKNLPILDGIVHCAGINKNIPFSFSSRENLDSVFEINFYSPAELTRLCLKEKKIGKNGSIVFISSISGILCSAVASSIYSASKGAVNGLIKGMALDLAPKYIRVNSINPGVIETNIFSEGLITEEQLNEDKKKYPLKRFGKPEEVAYAAIYLLSDASSWITGSNIVIDGGFTLQ